MPSRGRSPLSESSQSDDDGRPPTQRSKHRNSHKRRIEEVDGPANDKRSTGKRAKIQNKSVSFNPQLVLTFFSIRPDDYKVYKSAARWICRGITLYDDVQDVFRVVGLMLQKSRSHPDPAEISDDSSDDSSPDDLQM